MPKSRSASLAEAQKLARDIICDPNYTLNLKARASAGILPPMVEQMLWHYGYGKPSDHLEINSTTRDLRTKPLDELASEAEALATRIRQAKTARETAIETLAAAEEARKDQQQSEQPFEEQRATDGNVHFADFTRKKDGSVH
jgi:hypothetical protein